MLKRFFLALVVFSPIFLQAQLVARTVKASNGQTIGFYEFTPSDYTKSGTKHPLIIFLHGVAERGNGTTELSRIAKVAIPKYLKNGMTMRFHVDGRWQSFVVLMPQLSSSYGGWQTFYTEEMINYANKNLNIDPDRIFLTGLSLGGGGVWSYASSSAANASKLAGIVPVCGTCGLSSAANLVNNKVAVWAFHGENDNRVTSACSKNAINAIKALKPTKDALLTLYNTTTHVIWDRAYDTGYTYQKPNVWEWMLRQSRSGVSTPPPAANIAPVAKVNGNISITLPTNSASLDGSGSTDSDGTISKYAWTKTSGPATFKITSPSSAKTTVTGLVEGTYSFRLTVTDNNGATATANVSVTVAPEPAPDPKENQPPVADAGGNQKVKGGSTILDGSGSKDPDGKITKVEWVQLKGPNNSKITNADQLKATASNMITGRYTFRLRVYDEHGAKGQQDIGISVSNDQEAADPDPDPDPVPDPKNNLPPVADAGGNQKVKGGSTILDGSGSKDPDGKITRVEWVQLKGPNNSKITNADQLKATASNLITGRYVYRLRVYDEFGAKGQQDIGISVSNDQEAPVPDPDPEPDPNNNLPPVADAGGNQKVKGGSTILDGSGSKDPDGKITRVEWVQLKGPNNSKITNADQLKATASNMITGRYVYRLRVYDEFGAKGQQDIGISVTNNGTTSSAAVAMSATEELSTLSPTTATVIPAINIYPNPATSLVNLQSAIDAQGSGYVTVYDISGKVVKRDAVQKKQAAFQHTLDVSELVKGTYFVDIIIDNKKATLTQFIKQ